MVSNFDEFRTVGLEAVVRGIDAYKRGTDTVVKEQDRAAESAEKTARRTEAAARKQIEAYNKIGRNAVIAGGIIVAALGAATVANIQWEKSFVAVEKTVDGTSAQLKEIEQDILSMSERIPIAATELARVAALAGQLGIRAEDITKFTETVAKLGVTTDLSADDAAVALAQLINVTGDTVDDLDRIASVIVDLGNNSATTESKILNFSQRIAATATNVGLTTQEILALSTTVLSLGINTERGATAVGKGLVAMQKAVAAGGEELRIFAETAELSVSEFQTLFREDALGAFQAFVSGLGRSGEQATQILDEVGLGAFRATDAFQALGRAQDQLAVSTLRANAAFAQNTAANEEFERFASTTAAELTLAFNQFLNVVREIGGVMIPFLKAAITLLTAMLDVWTEIPEPMRNFIVLAAGIFGLLLVGTGIVFLLRAKFIELSLAVAAAQLSVGGLAISMNLLIPVIGVVSAVVAAATVGLLAFGGAADDASVAQGQIINALNRHIERLEKLNEAATIIIATEEGMIEVLEKGAEAQDRLANGTARQIEISADQLKQVRELVSVGVELNDAWAIAALRADEAAGAQDAFNAALARAAIAAGTTDETLLKLIDDLVKTEEGLGDVNVELGKTEVQANKTGQALARMGSRALALNAALQVVANTLALERGELEGFEQVVRFAIEERTRSAQAAILTSVELEHRAGELADAWIEAAEAQLGITEGTKELGAAAIQMGVAFNEAVDAIETARAQMALGILLDELRRAGGQEGALALTVLLAGEARTGRDIVAGIRKIAELFPSIGGAVAGGGGGESTGFALLLKLLGAGGGSNIPSFQRGGFVGGSVPGAPVMARLHVGEAVLSRSMVGALAGGGRGGAGTTIQFEANYHVTQSPVTVRADLERLRLAGVI